MVNLSGVVTGLFGRPVNGALVTLKGTTKRYTEYTELDGSYVFEGIEVDTYTMTVQYWLYNVHLESITLEVDAVRNIVLSVSNYVKAGIVISAIVGGCGVAMAIREYGYARLKRK